MANRLILVLLFLTALLSACNGNQGDGQEAVTPWAVTETPPIDSGPVVGNGLVADCGTEHRGHGQDRNLASRDCLLQAYAAGSRAKWASKTWTTEGDPLETRVSISGTGLIEVEVDYRADKFSAPADRIVRTYHCDGLAVERVTLLPILRITGCADMPGGEMLL